MLAVFAAAVTACAGSSSPTTAKRIPPDLAAFLRLPVATPSDCPRSNATGTGRQSPWVGHVDVSVFVAAHVDNAGLHALHDALVAEPHVSRVYTETKKEAWEEFQRLYTCSAQVPRSAVRASYRLVLEQVTQPQRDAVVRAIYRLPDVGDVSCDPADPCVNIGRGG